MKNRKINRRDFLKYNAALALNSMSLLSILGSFDKVQASTSDDYKALVCIFLEGGNDGYNMLVPTSNIDYDNYKKIRGTLALSKDSLLGNIPHHNKTYGFHQSMSDIHKLYENGKLAVLANVGTLVHPTTKVEYENEQNLPFHLFSHSDQTKIWMAGNSKQTEKSGWAARLANTLPNNNNFTNISVGGNNFLQSGGDKSSLEISYTIDSFDNFNSLAFSNLYQKILARDKNNQNRLIQAYANLEENNINYRNSIVSALSTAKDFNFQSRIHCVSDINSFYKQMEFIAKLISVSAQMPGSPRRQIFFAKLRHWDTHDKQMEKHAKLLEYLSQTMYEFQSTMDFLNISDKVTTFTSSEFGRSLVPNNNGTDHGWGSHALIMGGAVNGGKIYGDIPELEHSGGQYTSPYITDSGRVIPTTSIEQYFAKLGEWFDIPVDKLNDIFPNLQAFSYMNEKMNFMKI
jgi:uncharacterized protein (DUF1501 family)